VAPPSEYVLFLKGNDYSLGVLNPPFLKGCGYSLFQLITIVSSSSWYLIHTPYSSTMRYYQYLFTLLICGYVIFQDASGVAKIKRSADESLRDPGTYIVCFENSTTNTQLQRFVKRLIERSNRRAKFEVKIISEDPSIKCLTARLSERALKWVRIYWLHYNKEHDMIYNILYS